MNGHPARLIEGLWCATLTPLTAAGSVDHQRLATHVKQLFAQHVTGIAPFGTTGEGQSLSLVERRDGLDRLFDAGVAPVRVLPGTGCASLAETIELTRHAVSSGCVGALVLPPFFWKQPGDDGLFAWYARLIDGVADPRLRIMLYHLPQVSAVPLSPDLVVRLAAAFPGVVAGIKDSEGKWENTQALLTRVPHLAVVSGHEPHLPKLMRAGGAGTICGVANVYPDLVRALLSPGVTAADEARVAKFIDILFSVPFLAAFKSIMADRTGDDGWRLLSPPLLPLAGADLNLLRRALRAGGFDY